jgi:ubiquinone/menaquinone biosynthesis C-methylase UbiE
MADPTPYDAARFREFERDGWNTVGRAYGDSFGSLTAQAIEPLLDAARVGSGTRLLDLACGPGHLCAAAARRGARVTGFDLSSTMIDEARSRNPEVTFREGDAAALPFPDASFDAVTIGFGMLHFAEPDRALAEARRVLAPGGRLAFTVWDDPERAVTFGLVLAAVERHGDPNVGLPPGPPFFRFAEADACKRALVEAGFTSPEVVTLPITNVVASTDDLVDVFLRGGVRTRAILLAQSPAAMAAIRKDVAAAAERFRRAGGLELPAPAVLSSAVRPPN